MSFSFLKQKETLLLLVLLAGAAALYIYLIRPNAVGLFFDDAAYLMLAQSLYEGTGYRLMHIAGEPWVQKYPPLYPVLLLGGLLINPPGSPTLVPLFCINVVITLGALVALYGYVVRCRNLPQGLALLLLLFMATYQRLVVAATGLWTEPLYLLLSLLILIQMAQLNKLEKWLKPLALLALTCGALYYTRTAGLILIVSLLPFIGFRCGVKPLLAFVGMVGALIFPWQLIQVLYPFPPSEVVDGFILRSFAHGYNEELALVFKYEMTPWQLFAESAQALANQFLGLFFLPTESWLNNHEWRRWIGIFGMAGLGALGFRWIMAALNKTMGPEQLYMLLYVGMLCMWPFADCNPRFMLVILPLLLLEGWDALQAHKALQQKVTAIAISLLGAMIVCNGVYLWPHLQKEDPNDLSWQQGVTGWQEYEAVVAYVRKNTPKTALLWSSKYPESMFFGLHTRRHVQDFFLQLPKPEMEKRAKALSQVILPDMPLEGSMQKIVLVYQEIFKQKGESQYKVLQQTGVDYVIQSNKGVVITPEGQGKLIDLREQDLATNMMIVKYPQTFEWLYTTPGGWFTVYKTHFDHPPTATPAKP